MLETLSRILQYPFVAGLLGSLIAFGVAALLTRSVMLRIVRELRNSARLLIDEVAGRVRRDSEEYQQFWRDIARGNERDYRQGLRGRAEFQGRYPEEWLQILKMQDERLREILQEQDQRLRFLFERQTENWHSIVERSEKISRGEGYSQKSATESLLRELNRLVERQDERLHYLVESQNEKLNLLLAARQEAQIEAARQTKALPEAHSSASTSFAIEFDHTVSASRACELIYQLTQAVHNQGGKVCLASADGRKVSHG
jgi:hypothetical protein